VDTFHAEHLLAGNLFGGVLSFSDLFLSCYVR
jgi:hypothetical protein